jgi:hypothetical protein
MDNSPKVPPPWGCFFSRRASAGMSVDEVALSTGFAKKPALNACVASTGEPAGLKVTSRTRYCESPAGGIRRMLSFELVGGVTAARRFVEAVDIITLAESHGGIETLRGRNQPVQVISSRHQYGFSIHAKD